ncbi:hypothetical protein DRP53_09065 [candidate division WOR-3 bacterium]|uniref:Type 4 fimbrial biogenesis protein PilX N-terminal domain-containing protein n=1 Tax=candidate division WOR-3 bacterium TaxID=2052148 RepID=A0A660SG65_UNCW3|nr:MAG: hypothetical protein DRP53_09065 [candidate division WOR-3 bacterium]
MRGIALVYALVIMFVSVMLIAAAVILSTTEIRLAGTTKIKTRKFDAAESGLEQFARHFGTYGEVDSADYNVQVGPTIEQVTVKITGKQLAKHASGFTISKAPLTKRLNYYTAPLTATVNPGKSQIQSVLDVQISYGPLGVGTEHD